MVGAHHALVLYGSRKVFHVSLDGPFVPLLESLQKALGIPSAYLVYVFDCKPQIVRNELQFRAFARMAREGRLDDLVLHVATGVTGGKLGDSAPVVGPHVVLLAAALAAGVGAKQAAGKTAALTLVIVGGVSVVHALKAQRRRRRVTLRTAVASALAVAAKGTAETIAQCRDLYVNNGAVLMLAAELTSHQATRHELESTTRDLREARRQAEYYAMVSARMQGELAALQQRVAELEEAAVQHAENRTDRAVSPITCCTVSSISLDLPESPQEDPSIPSSSASTSSSSPSPSSRSSASSSNSSSKLHTAGDQPVQHFPPPPAPLRRLRVTIHRATWLMHANLLNSSIYVFASMTAGKETAMNKSTSIRYMCIRPIWDETLVFDSPAGEDHHLELFVCSRAFGKRDEDPCLGIASLSFTAAEVEGTAIQPFAGDVSLRLPDAKGACGVLRVTIELAVRPRFCRSPAG